MMAYIEEFAQENGISSEDIAFILNKIKVNIGNIIVSLQSRKDPRRSGGSLKRKQAEMPTRTVLCA